MRVGREVSQDRSAGTRSRPRRSHRSPMPSADPRGPERERRDRATWTSRRTGGASRRSDATVGGLRDLSMGAPRCRVDWSVRQPSCDPRCAHYRRHRQFRQGRNTSGHTVTRNLVSAAPRAATQRWRHAATARRTGASRGHGGIRGLGQGLVATHVRPRHTHPPRLGPRTGRCAGGARPGMAPRASAAGCRRVGCLALSTHRACLLPVSADGEAAGRGRAARGARPGTGRDSSTFRCRSPTTINSDASLADCPSTIGRCSSSTSTSGLPIADVAGVLDIPVGTVKSRLNRGLEQMRASMRADPDVGPRLVRERSA